MATVNARVVPSVVLAVALGAGPGALARPWSQDPPAAAESDKPVQAGADVPAPKRKKLVLPEYPEKAKSLGVRGIVLVELVVERDGSVQEAQIVRSIPELDEAALAAVREWEYEVTKVDGAPVRVRLAVPITFSMKLPDLARSAGVPELRQGAAPAFPPEGGSNANLEAEVTLDPTGRVVEVIVIKGNSPWAEMLQRALYTWAFNWDKPDTFMAFRVQARFERGRSTDDSRVTLSATDPRELLAETPAPVASLPSTEPPAMPGPSPSPPPPVPAPSPEPPAAPAAPAAPAEPETPAEPAGAHEGLVGRRAAEPAIETIRVPRPAPPPGSAPATPAPPPTEPADRPGTSAVRDVTLATGVPDLAQGRRPIVPPLARMNGVTGRVEVSFSVGVAGTTVVHSVNGPDTLQAAARGCAESWLFRRTTTERLYLSATIDYGPDTAKAAIARAPAATPAP